MMKLRGWLCPVLLICFSVAWAEGTVVLSVELSNSSVPIGQDFDANILVQAGSQQVDGTSAFLEFDPIFLEVVSMTAGDQLDTVIENIFDNDAGYIDFSAGKFSAPFPSGNFELVTIHLKAKAETASTSLDFLFDLPKSTNVTFGGTSVFDHAENGVLRIEEPTLVTLAYFTATVFDGNVMLEWQTELEIDNAGFHLWRSETIDGDYIRITGSLIPAQDSYFQYDYVDEAINDELIYMLEDVNLYGVSTFHAPISAAKILMPITGAVLPRTIATFEWLNHPDVSGFKLQFSNQPDFSGNIVTMPKKRITDNFYTPKRREWRQIKRLGRQGMPIYWRVSAKTNVRFIYSEIGSFMVMPR
jgi:hypothetical protein